MIYLKKNITQHSNKISFVVVVCWFVLNGNGDINPPVAVTMEFSSLNPYGPLPSIRVKNLIILCSGRLLCQTEVTNQVHCWVRWTFIVRSCDNAMKHIVNLMSQGKYIGLNSHFSTWSVSTSFALQTNPVIIRLCLELGSSDSPPK